MESDFDEGAQRERDRAPGTNDNEHRTDDNEHRGSDNSERGHGDAGNADEHEQRADEHEQRADDDMRAHEDSARAALSALDADRRSLADRIRTPAWYYPLLGVATAMIIGSPGAGIPTQFLLVAFGCLGITFLSLAYQQRTGLTITRMAGPRSRTAAILLGVFIVLLLAVSFSLTATGHAVWVWLTAGAAFAAMWGGGSIYDRAYDRELRRGR